METRIACLHLASALLETDDSVVASYVTAAGSREGRTGPGIVNVAVQKALHHSSLFPSGGEEEEEDDDEKREEDREHHRDIHRLLRNVRLKLLRPTAGSVTDSTAKRTIQNNPAPVSNRALIDLLKREPLDGVGVSEGVVIMEQRWWSGVGRNGWCRVRDGGGLDGLDREIVLSRQQKRVVRRVVFVG